MDLIQRRFPPLVTAACRSAALACSVVLFAGVLCPGKAFAADGLQQQVIYNAGDNGYHTFRIPALVTTNSGAMLAFAEGRSGSTIDREINDLVLRRSFDNGQTWQSIQVVVPGVANNQNLNCPTPIVDRVTGDIVMPYILNADQVFVTRSSDDGATWSAPEEITSQVKDPAWGFYAPGPGHAIQLDNGRLLVPAYHRDIGAELSYGHSFYSDDHGATWQLGSTVTGGYAMQEGTAVQLMDGSVTQIMRFDYGESPIRYFSNSTDDGATWSEATSDSDLGNVNVQGSVIRFTDQINDDANRILFSTPHGTNVREQMSVLTSYDETASFVNPRTVYWGPSAYSDMTISPDQTVNLLYERGRYNLGYNHIYQQIAFAQFDREWLENGPPDKVQWDFAEKDSGTPNTRDGSILDSSGVDMHATAMNGPTYVPGAPGGDGRALHFNASDDYIVLTQDDSSTFFEFGTNDSFTIEAMIRTTSHGSGGFANGGVIIGSGANTTSPYWLLQIDNGQIRFVLRDVFNRTRTLLGGTGLANGEWFKIDAVRDKNDNQFKLYINDELVASSFDNLTDIKNSADIMIGEWTDLSRSFIGDIDYISVTRDAFAPVAVPEPSSYVLLAIGAIGLGWFKRRRAPVRLTDR